jgi:lipoate-protein ligase A
MTTLALEEWLLLESGPGTAAWNMAMDEALLRSVAGLGRPVLRFYAWTEPAATFGFSQRYRDVEGWTGLRPLVRRPTGGGLVPHSGDWTYSVAVPPGHGWYGLRARQSYARIHCWVREAFLETGMAVELAPAPRPEAPGRCFMGAEQDDVVWQGRKIAGAAQRRNRLGLLIQGSIQPPAGSPGRAAFERAFLAVGARAQGIGWLAMRHPVALLELAAGLEADKYGRADHNEAR